MFKSSIKSEDLERLAATLRRHGELIRQSMTTAAEACRRLTLNFRCWPRIELRHHKEYRVVELRGFARAWHWLVCRSNGWAFTGRTRKLVWVCRAYVLPPRTPVEYLDPIKEAAADKLTPTQRIAIEAVVRNSPEGAIIIGVPSGAGKVRKAQAEGRAIRPAPPASDADKDSA